MFVIYLVFYFWYIFFSTFSCWWIFSYKEIAFQYIFSKMVNDYTTNVLVCSTMYYYVLLCSTMFYYVLLCSTMFYYVLLCTTMFYYVLLCSIMYYYVLVCSTMFLEHCSNIRIAALYQIWKNGPNMCYISVTLWIL